MQHQEEKIKKKETFYSCIDVALTDFLQYGFFCAHFSDLPHGVWEQHTKSQELLFS